MAFNYELKINIFGKNKIETKPYNFKGLKNIEIEEVEGFFKYYYGVTTNYNEAVESLKTAKSAGYDSAFLVAFKNNEKISITESMKMQ